MVITHRYIILTTHDCHTANTYRNEDSVKYLVISVMSEVSKIIFRWTIIIIIVYLIIISTSSQQDEPDWGQDEVAVLTG